MSIRVRKIEYVIHMDRLDDSGNVVDEITTQQPLVIWPHQFDDVKTQVTAVVAQAEQQLAPEPPTENGNRAQRRAAAKAPNRVS